MTDACATPDLLSLEDALSQIANALPPYNQYEQLPLKQALNRVTYSDINSTVNVPSFRNSSMDGYALSSKNSATKSLTVIGTSWAGKPFTGDVPTDCCLRIFTGAYVPNDCDCVVMQENATQLNGTIKINKPTQLDDNIRHIGDDSKCGELVLPSNTIINAANIGLLASCGITDVAVYKQLNVGFFSTGDELASIGASLELGQIFDSNRYTLAAMIEQSGAIPIDMGVIVDNPQAVETALLSASEQCDVIITSGGVSVGEADYITDVLSKIGTVNLWRIAIKPGKPLVFGFINGSAFFGLPGNPVSVMVTYQQIVRPILEKMMGTGTHSNRLLLQAKTTAKLYKQPGRKEFQRGFVENINGQLVVSSTGEQGSHMLRSMAEANCFIVLEQETGNINEGQLVTVQLLGTNT